MNDSPKETASLKPGMLAGNLGKPIQLTGVQLNGIAAEAARQGERVKLWVRLSLTSDDRLFHLAVEGIAGHIEYLAAQAGHLVRLSGCGFALLIIHPDNGGDLWLDTAAVTMKAMAKRPVQAGSAVFESDIADITALSFPLVEIDKADRVVCIFREGWRFGLFCDFNPAEELSIENMERELGTLYRRLKYRDIYEAIADQQVFERLVGAGWFPFVEIIGAEFRNLIRMSTSGLGLETAEQTILTAFDAARVEHMFNRWMAKPHFSGKKPLLRSALDNFVKGDAVAVLKIVLTEIEGILGEAYWNVHGRGAKLKELLAFAILAAEQKSGRPDTLLFPAAFAHYLRSHTFANYDPVSRTGRASSRHAVGHGSADAASYTQLRALQALLTLDQLAFYT